MPGLNAIIIDDERDACSILEDMLANSGHFSSIDSYTDPEKGMNEVLLNKPDVLFLDIQMPGISGIDIIKQIGPWKGQTRVVFVTAFSEYGMEAAKNNAFDYLLKPVDTEELNSLLVKLTASKKASINPNNESIDEDRLLVWSARGIEILLYQDIVYLEADKNYSIIKHVNGNTILSSRSLGRIEEGLPPEKFQRISRKHIINDIYLKSVNFKDKTCCLEWKDGSAKLNYTRRLTDFIKEKNEPKV